MGLAESKLEPTAVKAIIRQDSLSKLPLFSMDTAKFSNGTSGFVISRTDLAKNTEVYAVSIKFVYSPSENYLIFVGNDESRFAFVKDRLTGKVVCSLSLHTKENVTEFCVTNYEPLEDAVIDKIGELYTKKS